VRSEGPRAKPLDERAAPAHPDERRSASGKSAEISEPRPPSRHDVIRSSSASPTVAGTFAIFFKVSEHE